MTTPPLPRRLRIVSRLPDAFIAEPFEILLLFMSLMAGLVTILVAPDNAIRRAMPAPLLMAWGTALCSAAVLGFVGWGVISKATTIPRRNYGRQLERLSMIIFMWTSLLWSGALVSYGWKAVPQGTLTLAFALACGVRAYVIRALIQVHELSRLEVIRLMKQQEGP